MSCNRTAAADEAQCRALRREIFRVLRDADLHRLRLVLQFVRPLGR